VSPKNGIITNFGQFELDTFPMRFRRSGYRPLPSSRYFTNSYAGLSNKGSKLFKIRSTQQVIALVLAAALTASGVAASVAITLRGNNSTQDGVVSLGVGQAVANSCDTTTTTKTDTVSQYVDTYTDFVLQQLNVYNVDPGCGGKAMTLVVRMTSGGDVNLTCSLPASNAISGLTTSTYNLATFIFTTTSTYTTSAVGQYFCGNASNLIPYSPTPKYMASIAATAVQIQ
jgi:hypothetical protein